MIRFMLRPVFWLIGLILDALLAIGIVTFGSAGGLAFPLGAVAMVALLVLETRNVALGIAAVVVVFLGIAIETRNDKYMQAELSKYRKRPRPLFGPRR